MTISNYKEAYVWIWLPEELSPIVAGKVSEQGFVYGKSYLERKNAISLYDKELPLKEGLQSNLLSTSNLPSCIRDASPDAWGRRVIINRKFGVNVANNISNADISELAFLLESGSDRIGALDFQLSPTEYIPRNSSQASLEELMQSADKVEKGVPLNENLDAALNHGTSIGGARPKALIDAGKHKYIAKFSSTTDTYSVIKVEYIAMRLAKLVGLNVADVKLKKSMGRDVLLIERFDRFYTKAGWQRKGMLSALTLLGLDELQARYASYEELAVIIRHRFTKPKDTLKEMYARLVFNVLCGNNDDHARNHAVFWNGKDLELTPAYDICPQNRTGNEASQAMLILGDNRSSKISICLATSDNFMLSKKEANKIVDGQVQIINDEWNNVCDEAKLSKVDRNLFWHRQFLNPYIFEE